MRLRVPPRNRSLVSVSDGLLAFDATGEQLWSAPLPSRVVGAPVVWEESIYIVVHSEPELRCLDVADGTEDWTQNVGDVSFGPSVTTEGVIVAADKDLAVHEHTTGEQKRKLDGPPADDSWHDRARGAAVADGTAYWMTNDKLAAVTVADGAVEWRLDIRARAEGLCVGQDTVVAPVSYDGFDVRTSRPTVAAFDRKSGDTRWYYAIDGVDAAFTTPPILVDGAVYFISNTINGVGALGDVSPADDSWLS